MDNIIFLSVAFVLLLIAYYYSSKMYYRQLLNWNNEITWKKVLMYITPISIKSIIALTLLIFIHNSFHDDHLLELTLFIFVFFLFSIFQSSFSIAGFFNRNKYVYGSFLSFFKGSSIKLNTLFGKLSNSIDGAKLIIRLLIIVGFILVFIPNFSLYVTTNIIFLMLIILMVGLSLLQNNIIYFGLTSLLVFQLNESVIEWNNIPFLPLTLSFFVIVLGVVLETRLERRMFILIKVLPVKRLNFNLGYNIVWDKRSIIIYQNQINHYYYTYFRKIGVVVVYHSIYDAKISFMVLNRMIQYGKRYLTENNID